MAIKLSRDQVNSWRLSRQYLLHRAPKRQMVKVVSEVCGVQAQVMSGAETAIWARVDGIRVQDVEDALWKQRRLVKTWCMRGTLHLLAADDLPLYVAALKRTRTGYMSNSWLKFHKISLEEIDTITRESRNALNGRCLTREDLVNDIVKRAGLRGWVKQEMSSGWGSLLHPAAYQGNLCFGPSQGKNVTFVRPDQWLGKWDEPQSLEAIRALLSRFISNYGPCSHENFGHWWGVPESNARKIFRSIIGDLEEVEYEGRKTWVRREDLEQIRASRKSDSVRLVPSFDPYVMFYSPRELLVERRFRAKVFRQLAGWNSPVLLVDGTAAGIWRYAKRPNKIHVTVESFRPLSSKEQTLVREEVERLEEFVSAETELSFEASLDS